VLLLRLWLAGADGHDGHGVLVEAHPYAVHAALTLTPWQLRLGSSSSPWHRWLAAVPVRVGEFLWLLCSLSGGLAVLNVLPVSLLDGAHVARAALRWWNLSPPRQDMVLTVAARLSLALLAANLAAAAWVRWVL